MAAKMPDDATKRCEYSVDSMDAKDEGSHTRRGANQFGHGRDAKDSIRTCGRREEVEEGWMDGWRGSGWTEGSDVGTNARRGGWEMRRSTTSPSDESDSESHA